MNKILMCPPRFFEVCYDINPWMKNNEGKVQFELAQQQWQNLYQTICQQCEVVLIEPVAGLPDMVFTANAGLVDQDRCIVSSFRHLQRQPESSHFARFFETLGYQLLTFKRPGFFEGAGDALFDSQHRLWVGTGFRSEAHTLAEINRLMQVETLGLELVDPRWYHLDTAFCPLNNGWAMTFLGAFSAASQQLLQQSFGPKLICVSEQDALNFACNAVNIGQNIILHRASSALKQKLHQHGFQAIENDVSEFMKAGGACKCLTLALTL